MLEKNGNKGTTRKPSKLSLQMPSARETFCGKISRHEVPRNAMTKVEHVEDMA